MLIEGRRTLHDGMLDHEHDDFDSFVVELPAVGSPEELAERVRAAAEAAGVLRVKGFAEVAGKPMRLLVQAVGARVSHHYDRAWGPGEARGTRLVVIGLKGLDRGGGGGDPRGAGCGGVMRAGSARRPAVRPHGLRLPAPRTGAPGRAARGTVRRVREGSREAPSVQVRQPRQAQAVLPESGARGALG